MPQQQAVNTAHAFRDSPEQIRICSGPRAATSGNYEFMQNFLKNPQQPHGRNFYSDILAHKDAICNTFFEKFVNNFYKFC